MRASNARTSWSSAVCLNQGVVFMPQALYSILRWSWLEAGVANGSFIVHASRPLIEAVIRTAGRLGPSRASCRGEAA